MRIKISSGYPIKKENKMKLNLSEITKLIESKVGRLKFKKHRPKDSKWIDRCEKNSLIFERERNGYLARIYVESSQENLSNFRFECKRLYAIGHLPKPYLIELINCKTGLVEYDYGKYRIDDKRKFSKIKRGSRV